MTWSSAIRTCRRTCSERRSCPESDSSQPHEGHLIRSRRAEEISKQRVWERLESRYGGNAKLALDPLQCGELARRDLTPFRHIYMLDREGKRYLLKRQKVRKNKYGNKEICVPTFNFPNEANLQKVTDKVIERFGQKKGFEGGVAVRQIWHGQVEAGVYWGHN